MHFFPDLLASSMAPTYSRVLDDDSLINKVSESIDAVIYYVRLGLDLLGNAADVSNVLGKPIPHFEDAMFQCLYTWRNEQGTGCEKTLMGIFEELGLEDALALLKEGKCCSFPYFPYLLLICSLAQTGYFTYVPEN